MYIFKNFKNFGDVSIDLSQPLSILIGPNGSGKSNLIEGMELLSFLSKGGSLDDVSDLGKDSKLEIRGNLYNCAGYKGDNFTLNFSGKIGKFHHYFHYQVTIDAKKAYFLSETLSVNRTVIFKLIPEKSTKYFSKVEYYNFRQQGNNKPHADASTKHSLLSQYKEFAEKNYKIDETIKLINLIVSLMSSFIFDPEPKLMRTYENIHHQALAKNGTHLSAVLYALSQGQAEEQQSLQRILNWIKQVPNEPFQDFKFVTTELNDVIFALQEAENERLSSANILSDGTLRCLAVLTALETAQKGARIIIEEFDNGLHPSRVGILVNAIADCIQRRQLKVLVTTHNPATLNALSLEQLKGVINCVYDNQQKTVKLIPLLELPRHVELLEQGKLGDLVTSELLERYADPSFEEKIKEKTLAWLNSL